MFAVSANGEDARRTNPTSHPDWPDSRSKTGDTYGQIALWLDDGRSSIYARQTSSPIDGQASQRKRNQRVGVGQVVGDFKAFVLQPHLWWLDPTKSSYYSSPSTPEVFDSASQWQEGIGNQSGVGVGNIKGSLLQSHWDWLDTQGSGDHTDEERPSETKMIAEKEKKLWQEMAKLTMKKCKEHCHQLGSCCSAEYCEMAKEFAAEQGIRLEESGNPKTPFLQVDGVCVVSPHLRPLCSLHQCKIAGLGFDMADPAWTKKYFKLRAQLERLMEKQKRAKSET
jgi:hypothetical protein